MPDALPTPALTVPSEADPLCISCGYNLRGLTLPTRCPECGENVSGGAPAHGFALAERDVARLRLALCLFALALIVPVLGMIVYTLFCLTVPVWMWLPPDIDTFYRLSAILGRSWSYSARLAPLLGVAGMLLIAAAGSPRRGRRRVLRWALLICAGCAVVAVMLTIVYVQVMNNPTWSLPVLRPLVGIRTVTALIPLVVWLDLLLMLQGRERRLRLALMLGLALGLVDAVIAELGTVATVFTPTAWVPPLTMFEWAPPPDWVTRLVRSLELVERVAIVRSFALLFVLWYLARRLARSTAAKSPLNEPTP